MSPKNRTIVLTVIVTLLVVFAVQNLHNVRVKVIVWNPSIPLVVLMALVFVGGVVADRLWRRR
jgi:uncharacterized integral membrane protein